MPDEPSPIKPWFWIDNAMTPCKVGEDHIPTVGKWLCRSSVVVQKWVFPWSAFLPMYVYTSPDHVVTLSYTPQTLKWKMNMLQQKPNNIYPTINFWVYVSFRECVKLLKHNSTIDYAPTLLSYFWRRILCSSTCIHIFYVCEIYSKYIFDSPTQSQILFRMFSNQRWYLNHICSRFQILEAPGFGFVKVKPWNRGRWGL